MRLVALGMKPSSRPWFSWLIVPVNSLVHVNAAAWLGLFLAMARSEPPRKTGATLPGFTPGRMNVPMLLAMDLLSATTWPSVQLPSMNIAALPLAKIEASDGVASLTLLDAGVDRAFWICWYAFRPARDFGVSRAPVQFPPFWTAIWPPLAHTNGMAAYHSSPGR